MILECFARAAGLALALVLLGGPQLALAQPQPRSWPAATSPAVVVVLDACPLSATGARMETALVAAAADVAMSLIAPAVSAVVNRGLDIAGRYLEQFADSYGASSTAVGGGRLLRIAGARAEPEAGCLVFVRGQLGSVATRPGAAVPANPAGLGAWQTQVAEINQKFLDEARRLGRSTAPRLLAAPEVYAEFGIVYRQFAVAAGTEPPILGQVALDPMFVRFGRSGAQRGASDEKSLVLTVTLSSLAPAAATPVTLLSQVFDIGRLAAPGAACRGAILPEAVRTLLDCRREILHEPEFHTLRSGGIVTVPRTGADGESSQFAVRDPVYLRAEVTLTEVQQAGDFARAIGEALRREQVADDASAKLLELVRGLLGAGRSPPQ
jgi:hypothetical protein